MPAASAAMTLARCYGCSRSKACTAEHHSLGSHNTHLHPACIVCAKSVPWLDPRVPAAAAVCLQNAQAAERASSRMKPSAAMSAAMQTARHAGASQHHSGGSSVSHHAQTLQPVSCIVAPACKIKRVHCHTHTQTIQERSALGAMATITLANKSHQHSNAARLSCNNCIRAAGPTTAHAMPSKVSWHTNTMQVPAHCMEHCQAGFTRSHLLLTKRHTAYVVRNAANKVKLSGAQCAATPQPATARASSMPYGAGLSTMHTWPYTRRLRQ